MAWDRASGVLEFKTGQIQVFMVLIILQLLSPAALASVAGNWTGSAWVSTPSECEGGWSTFSLELFEQNGTVTGDLNITFVAGYDCVEGEPVPLSGKMASSWLNGTLSDNGSIAVSGTIGEEPLFIYGTVSENTMTGTFSGPTCYIPSPDLCKTPVGTLNGFISATCVDCAPEKKDSDGDGLNDEDEPKYGTNPTDPDTDSDGLSDGDEVNKYKTDPLKNDTDGDGLTDGDEANKYGTDPTQADTDGDGLGDWDEIDVHGTDPLTLDSDGDGLPDGAEVNDYKTDPLKADSDGDGLNDGGEVDVHGTDPLKADTDNDSLNDGDEVNMHRTDPLKADTDGGGVSDGIEVQGGTDPLDPADDQPVLACKSNGEICVADLECCSANCMAGKCTSAIVEDGKTVSPKRSASRFEEAGTKSTTVREAERKVSVGFLVDVFGWSRKKIETASTCIMGSSCSASADCCGADCVEGYCLCSTRVCSSSGECCSGYCEEGLCRPPPSMLLYALSRPLQGCAGFVEECLPGEGSCFMLCDGLNILLLITSAGTGAVMWRRFVHPVAGIAAAAVLAFIGVGIYPFAGILAGLLVIVMLQFLKVEIETAPLALTEQPLVMQSPRAPPAGPPS